jgi:glucose/arabinose dehydrogenase
MRHSNIVATLCAALLLGTTTSPATAQTPRSPTPKPVPAPFTVTTVAQGLEHPWGLAFLPDGRMLVTERPGRLRIVSPQGEVSAPLSGVPRVFARGQGGLLDVAISPDFAQDRLVYLSFAEPAEGGARTAVARGRLGERGLENVQVIWRQTPVGSTPIHFGSRLVFARDGMLFVTTGDRLNMRPAVQDLSTTIGKVVRIAPDGSIPKDNPFVGRDGALRDIWSYGHRNIQAATLHPETGQLWTVEHGARGGDELNNPQPGRNYGWAVITYGVEYSGEPISKETARPGMEQPVYYWDPVIAPSGAVFYTGEAFPAWRGDLLVGSLTTQSLVRLDLENGRIANEERYSEGIEGRVRDVQQGPDGLIYLLTDSPQGRVLRLAARAAR